MGATKTKEKHPKGFYACCITFMFERLAFYGAKPLLLLFLITAVAEGGLGIERTDAGDHGCESDSVHLYGTADRRRDFRQMAWGKICHLAWLHYYGIRIHRRMAGR